jgi:hypothetical protein
MSLCFCKLVDKKNIKDRAYVIIIIKLIATSFVLQNLGHVVTHSKIVLLNLTLFK